MSEVILEIKDLKKYFPLANGKTVKAVDGVSMKMYKGETLGLVGESGCGKSTIALTVPYLPDVQNPSGIPRLSLLSAQNALHYDACCR